MSVPADLFIGLITYPGTRFPESAGPDGLAAQLQSALAAEGAKALIGVRADDEYSETVLRIDREAIERSIQAELATEAAWRRFLSGGRGRLRMRAEMFLRLRKRRRALLPNSTASLSPDQPGARMVRRLVNIELAHMSLLREAAESRCSWALILEDDADGKDVRSLAERVAHFMHEWDDKRQPKFVNVSESFDAHTLGIEKLLTHVGQWNPGAEPFAIYSSRLPVTNTVCAILYRADFLRELLAEMESIPVDPVIPIDWKLNQALMNLSQRGGVSEGDSWILIPAPIVQRSMI